MRHARSLLAVLLFALLMPLLATPASAQDATPAASPDAQATPGLDTGPRFVIRPIDGGDGDYFTLEAEAGTTNDLTVVLGNADDEDLELRTYVNDVLPIVNGGFALASEAVTPTGTATWIDYPAETFTFAPAEGIERTFTVTIPEDAAPGQYIAGLSLETAEPLEVEGTTLFRQVVRKTIAVFIIVPGEETPAFSVGEPTLVTDGALDRLEFTVSNNGNVLVRPEGTVTIRDAAGEVALESPVTMGSVYAGLDVPLNVALTTPLPDGEYTVDITLEDSESGVTATQDDVALMIDAAAADQPRITVDGAVTLSPDSANPAFAEVALIVSNPLEPIAQAEVLLEVARDGEIVETFPLASGIALPQGDTTVSQRYVPPTGWESGEWTFTVRVNAVDASTGTTTAIATLDTLAPVTVGE